MDYAWHDLVGNAGVALILITFLMLQLERIKSVDVAYSMLNALGAGMILVSLCFDFNLSAFIVEAAWVIISLVGVVRWFVMRDRLVSPPAGVAAKRG